MKNIIVAIVTDDKEYGRSLSLAILNVCRSFVIRIYNAEEFFALKDYYDLILWDGDEARENYGGRIVLLTEKTSEIIKDNVEKRYCIYKFSSAAVFVAELFDIYEKVTGKRTVNIKRQAVRLFAITSFKGGSGCTTIAMALCQELKRFQGERVMYLSFEETESTGEYMVNDGNVRGASVYLYDLFSNSHSKPSLNVSEESMPYIEGRVIRDEHGVEAFSPSNGRNPLREIDSEEMDRFIASLIDSGRYSAIVMDMGQLLSNAGIKCLEMAESICVVAEKYEDTTREKQYISQLISCCGEGVLEKIIKIVNKPANTDSEEGGESDFYKPGYIVVSEGKTFVRDEERMRIMLEGSFGNDIEKLAKKISEPVCEKGVRTLKNI